MLSYNYNCNIYWPFWSCVRKWGRAVNPPPPPPHPHIFKYWELTGKEGIIYDVILHETWRHLCKKTCEKDLVEVVTFVPDWFISHQSCIIITMTYRGFWGNVRCLKLNSSNNAKYLKFHWQKVESTRNSELWQLSRRFQTLIWRPGEMVQNRESPGLYRRVDSTAGSCWDWSCWDWLFDQVWCSKVEREPSYDSWNMVKDPYKCLLFCDSVPQNPINSLKYFSLFCLTVKFVMHLLLGRN